MLNGLNQSEWSNPPVNVKGGHVFCSYSVRFYNISKVTDGFPQGSVVKNIPANSRDTANTSSIPGSGKSPGEGNGSPLQYSCLENSMDRGVWHGIVHKVAKSCTRLSDWARMNTRSQIDLNGFLCILMLLLMTTTLCNHDKITLRAKTQMRMMKHKGDESVKSLPKKKKEERNLENCLSVLVP